MKRICCLVLMFVISLHSSGFGANLVVVAGSASQPVLEEAAAQFEKISGASVTMLLGGSGELLAKVRLTQIGDVYLPGSHDFLELAKRQGLLATGTEKTFAYLVPAICVPASNPLGIHSLADLASPGLRIGIGHPGTVCVGLYAVEIMERAGLVSTIRPNVVTYFESCAKVANAVSLGSVDAVLGWREFGSWAPSRIQVIPLPPDQIARVATLPGAVLVTSKQAGLAGRFLAFLASPAGQAIYEKWGYLTVEKDVRALAPRAVIGGLYDLPEGWRE